MKTIINTIELHRLFKERLRSEISNLHGSVFGLNSKKGVFSVLFYQSSPESIKESFNVSIEEIPNRLRCTFLIRTSEETVLKNADISYTDILFCDVSITRENGISGPFAVYCASSIPLTQNEYDKLYSAQKHRFSLNSATEDFYSFRIFAAKQIGIVVSHFIDGFSEWVENHPNSVLRKPE